MRAAWIAALGQDDELRDQALALQGAAERHRYGYHAHWCGVPIIRLPDDILVFQEIVWTLRPAFIVETGVARGGSLALSASLMSMCGLPSRVLGLDIQILDHARRAVQSLPWSDGITLWEGDSSGQDAAEAVRSFVASSPQGRPGILVLDSDHSQEHVLRELMTLAPEMPVGSIVQVADTIIEEFDPGHYPDRPWGKGNSPLTAVNEFLSIDPRFERSQMWSRRALVTEFRDGTLQRVA